MKKKEKTMLIVILLALAACGVLSYLWIDRSISLNYLQQSIDASDASRRRLERLLALAWGGASEKAILEKLRADAGNHPNESSSIKIEADTVWYEETRFNFKGGELKSIGEP